MFGGVDANEDLLSELCKQESYWSIIRTELMGWKVWRSNFQSMIMYH